MVATGAVVAGGVVAAGAAVGTGAAPPQAAVKIIAVPARLEINQGNRFKSSPNYIQLDCAIALRLHNFFSAARLGCYFNHNPELMSQN